MGPVLNPVLEMRGIVKEFPGVRALDDVTFVVHAGETLALVGENGAGKSTLMKVLSGVYPHGTYGGQLLAKGAAVAFRGTRDAEDHGIAIIHQELNLFPDLSVAENLFVGRYLKTALGLVDWPAIARRSREVLARLGATFSPDAKVRSLSVGDGQLVEIARALLKNAEILILDEPTSALSEREVERLYGIIEDLAARGVACVYISHKLDEVYKLCDRVVVLRDGKSVGGGPLPDTTRDQLITMMVGRPMAALFPPKLTTAATAPVLRCKDVRGITFEAFPGEILGIGGMMGSGRSELLNALIGNPDLPVDGEVTVDGKPVPRRTVRGAVQAGLALVTEDRKRTGLHLGLTIRENVSLASLHRVAKGGVVDAKHEAARAAAYSQRLRIKAPTVEALVGNLSGGNQQKVAIAKWCATHPRVLMLDEPTRGVDVNAKFEIYSLLRELAGQGLAVVIVSSEVLELVGLCREVLVLREGKLAGRLADAEVTSENILRLAVGGGLTT